ncbi:MAG: immunity protein Imm33 domain-containing protein [Thermoguttaceae bacterium]
MIREQALEYLKAHGAQPGETVLFSWFLFRLANVDGQLDIETLDFESVASYTRSFELVEQIHAAQVQVLRQEQVEPEFCNLRQCAICSKSYAAGSPQAFLSRIGPAHKAEAGWYVGVVDDPLDLDDRRNLNVRSLYEISIRDRRFLPYWLLPPGYRIAFGGESPEVTREQPG